MIFLPPFTPNALENVLTRLTPEALDEALNEGLSREVELQLPRFSFEKTYQMVPVCCAPQLTIASNLTDDYFGHSRSSLAWASMIFSNQQLIWLASVIAPTYSLTMLYTNQKSKSMKRVQQQPVRRFLSDGQIFCWQKKCNTSILTYSRYRPLQFSIVKAIRTGPILLWPSVHVPHLRSQVQSHIVCWCLSRARRVNRHWFWIGSTWSERIIRNLINLFIYLRSKSRCNHNQLPKFKMYLCMATCNVYMAL